MKSTLKKYGFYWGCFSCIQKRKYLSIMQNKYLDKYIIVGYNKYCCKKMTTLCA
jgi:hypothetical protein